MTKRAEVLNQFMRRQGKYRAYAYTLACDWSIAEDATQETAVYICDNWTKFKPGTNFDAWVRTILNYRCRILLQKEYMEVKKKRNIADVIDDVVWDEVAHYDSDKIKALHGCIEKLPERTRNIFSLFYQDKIKCPIISKMLKMKEAATHQILSRARRSLKQCISKQLEES